MARTGFMQRMKGFVQQAPMSSAGRNQTLARIGQADQPKIASGFPENGLAEPVSALQR